MDPEDRAIAVPVVLVEVLTALTYGLPKYAPMVAMVAMAEEAAMAVVVVLVVMVPAVSPLRSSG